MTGLMCLGLIFFTLADSKVKRARQSQAYKKLIFWNSSYHPALI